MSELDQITALEHQHEVAAAARAAAEDLGWPIAIMVGALMQTEFHHWWISVPAAAVGFILATYRYRKDEEAKEDAWLKAAGLGKYWKPPPGYTEIPPHP